MKNKLIFWRHAETKIDKDTPVSQWDITEAGQKQAQEVVDSGVFDEVNIIFTSSELKAIKTTAPCAERLDLESIQIEDLGEINRDKGGLLSDEEYKEMKRKVFEDFDYTKHGWETVNQAIQRFTKAVAKIDKAHENKTILIVAHGTVMTLYFSQIQGKIDQLMDRWSGLGFCDWGVIENGVVTKDIV